VGTVLAANPQGLVLATRSTPDQVPTVEIPLEAIESLEISLGQRSNTLNGLAYGALGGAVLGAAVVAVSCLAEGCSGDGASAGGWIAFGAIVGAGGGAVLGLLVGSLVKTETWGIPAPGSSWILQRSPETGQFSQLLPRPACTA
jgi:hypothetical protein